MLFSLKGSPTGFRSDRLNHLIVCRLHQQSVWWKVNSCMLVRRKACKTFPSLEYDSQSWCTISNLQLYSRPACHILRYQGFAGIRDNPLSRIHPLVEWWKVECCMLGYRKACCCTFDSYSSLKQIIRPQEWLCHSWLRMVQSLQITGMKQNVLFLQRASMRKLIKGKHEKRCSFLERKGARRSRWIVDSTLFE